MYTNADSLLNKRQDLMYHIDSAEIKPKIIAICEAMPKRHLAVLQSEFSLQGYNLVSNIVEDNIYNNRGILIYIVEKKSILHWWNLNHKLMNFWLLKLVIIMILKKNCCS